MLNAIYDTLERLGINNVLSNSEQGKLEFETNGSRLIFAVDTICSKEKVDVTLTSKQGEMDCSFVEALFDEISSTLLVTQNLQ